MTRLSSRAPPSLICEKSCSSETDFWRRRELLLAQALSALLSLVAGLPLRLDEAEALAGGRRMIEAEHLDRYRRPGLLGLAAVVVLERAHLAPGIARDERDAGVERAALHEHGRDRPAADVEARLDHDALRRGLGIGLELQDVGLQQQHLEQLVQPGALLGGDVDEDRRPAPLLGLQAERRELGAHALRIGVGAVDLVDRDHDRHLGGLGVVDRLDRLRHDAVVRGDDQHHDVGDAAGAGAHGGERLVARRVEERDRAAVVAHDRLVGADVLRDAAGLAGHDARLADGVEQTRLAVIDVAHDRHDRSARDEILGRVVEDLFGRDLIGCARNRDLALELGADHLDGLVRQRLRDPDELAEAHHDLLDLRGRDAQRRGQVLDRDTGADGRGTRGRRDFLAALGAVLAATTAASLARVALRARRGGVDHDAAAAAELGAALRAGDARAAGRIGARAVAAGRRPSATGCGPLAALRACRAGPGCGGPCSSRRGRRGTRGGGRSRSCRRRRGTRRAVRAAAAERTRRRGLVDGVALQANAGLGEAAGHLAGIEPALAGNIGYTLSRHLERDCIRVPLHPPPRHGRLAKARRRRSHARARTGSEAPAECSSP